MITDKTIKSKYQPKQTNATWVDLSGETPVEKHFINGKWAEISGGGKGSQQDPGYTVTKSYVTLDEETLTTNPGDGFIVGFQNDFQLIYGDTYIVTYNGVKYKCVADKDYECIRIGGHNGDFSEYPFRIAYFFDEEYTLLFAETQGTYTVKIEHLEESVEITNSFKMAVNTVLGSGGSTSGISTIDKNTQPNIVWREPTEEDLAKFHNDVEQVADLPDGKVPLLAVGVNENVELFAVPLFFLSFPTGETDGLVVYGLGDQGTECVLSEDWSLLGIQNIGR